MPIPYLLFLATCSALTLILMVPGVAMMATIFTIGLAIPLMFLVLMATILLWTLLPAALCWRTRARWPLVVVGLVLPVTLLAMPPVLADRAAARLVADVGITQPAPMPLTGPIGVEIIRDVQHNQDLYARSAGQSALYTQAPCFDLCERLLLGGKVAWVRIVLRDDAFLNTSTRTQALFVAASGAACTAANPDLSIDTPCVLFAPDHGQPPSLTLDLADNRIKSSERAGTLFFQEIGTRTAIAYPGADSSAVVFRARQVFYDRPTGLLGFDLGNFGSGDSGGGLSMLRQSSATTPIDLSAAFAAMGFPLASKREVQPKAPGTEGNSFIQAPPDAQDAAYVASMLATGPEGGATFSSAFKLVVNDWHQRLRSKPELSAGDRAIFCASLNDPRIKSYHWSDQVIKRHKLACS
jgi:hypothetical protein